MPLTHHISPKSGDLVLLVGTMKGAFMLRGGARRAEWEIGGPYFPGSAVYAMAYDSRAGRHRAWAGPRSMPWGGMLQSSDDFGKTWKNQTDAYVKIPMSCDDD